MYHRCGGFWFYRVIFFFLDDENWFCVAECRLFYFEWSQQTWNREECPHVLPQKSLESEGYFWSDLLTTWICAENVFTRSGNPHSIRHIFISVVLCHNRDKHFFLSVCDLGSVSLCNLHRNALIPWARCLLNCISFKPARQERFLYKKKNVKMAWTSCIWGSWWMRLVVIVNNV